MWNQFEQSRKSLEDAELQAERERQMLATMPEGYEKAAKKRKASNADIPSKSTKVEFVDTTSLFTKYHCNIIIMFNIEFD